ncbi:ribonuclease domain-containing protein [Emticicia aquatica]|uniref:ribonuclease domain-containing protein n=1 Tax=Emticicia aquatica TaxID=1681835 RepID=UPI001EECA80E|nr:ribonuclease domain-containing protein [Emticicia aquatica]
MKPFLKNSFFLFLFISQAFLTCRQAPKNETYKSPETIQNAVKSDVSEEKTKKKDYKNESKVPQKVLETLKYVRENGVAPNGYVGGRKFGNYEGLLPKKEANGRKINYQEWDVNPKIAGKNRGAERLITSSDGKAYFTKNHYKSFIEIP